MESKRKSKFILLFPYQKGGSSPFNFGRRNFLGIFRNDSQNMRIFSMYSENSSVSRSVVDFIFVYTVHVGHVHSSFKNSFQKTSCHSSFVYQYSVFFTRNPMIDQYQLFCSRDRMCFSVLSTISQFPSESVSITSVSD